MDQQTVDQFARFCLGHAVNGLGTPPRRGGVT